MLERAKERTAAEFGVVQAVLQAGSTGTLWGIIWSIRFLWTCTH